MDYTTCHGFCKFCDYGCEAYNPAQEGWEEPTPVVANHPEEQE